MGLHLMKRKVLSFCNKYTGDFHSLLNVVYVLFN